MVAGNAADRRSTRKISRSPHMGIVATVRLAVSRGPAYVLSAAFTHRSAVAVAPFPSRILQSNPSGVSRNRPPVIGQALHGAIASTSLGSTSFLDAQNHRPNSLDFHAARDRWLPTPCGGVPRPLMLLVTVVPQPGDFRLTVGRGQAAPDNLPNGIHVCACERKIYTVSR